MGMYNEVIIDQRFELPEYPTNAVRKFQTKDIEPRSLHTYRITGEGVLQKKEVERCEKTAEEKQKEAEEQGFDSWDEYVEWHEKKMNEGESPLQLFLERDIHPLGPMETKVDQMWWEEYSYDGRLNFYNSPSLIDSINESYSYTADISNGEVEDIHRDS
jgi:hypothetical protein